MMPVDLLDANRWPTNSLIAAVIWQLPREGARFDAIARQKWLHMMAMAFEVAYGTAEAGASALELGAAARAMERAEPEQATPPRPAHAIAGSEYYVDDNGMVRCDSRTNGQGIVTATPGRRVNAAEIDRDEPVYDYRRGKARARGTVVFADGCVGAPAAMSFCGPG
jgi:hypothetical protein